MATKKKKKVKKKSAKPKEEELEEELEEEEVEEEIEDEDAPSEKSKKKKAKVKKKGKGKSAATVDAEEQKLDAIRGYLKKGKEFPYRSGTSAGLAFEIIENKGDGKSVKKLIEYFEGKLKGKKISCSNPEGRFRRVLRDCVAVKMVEVKKGKVHHL